MQRTLFMCAVTYFRAALKRVLEGSHPQITYTFEKKPFQKTGRRHNPLIVPRQKHLTF